MIDSVENKCRTLVRRTGINHGERGLAGEHQGGIHSRVVSHLDVGVQPVSDHDAIGEVNLESFSDALKHDPIGLSRIRLTLNTGACFDRCNDSGGIRLATPFGEWAVLIRVGRHEDRPLELPNSIERDLELPIVKRSVVAGDHDVDLFRVFGDLDPSSGQRTDEWFLGDREYGGVGVVSFQPRHDADHGIDDGRDVDLQPQFVEFLDVHFGIKGGVIREKDRAQIVRLKMLDQPTSPREQLVAQINGSVEIEDVCLICSIWSTGRYCGFDFAIQCQLLTFAKRAKTSRVDG